MGIIGLLSLLMLIWLAYSLLFQRISVGEAVKLVGALMLFLILSPFVLALFAAALPKLLLVFAVVMIALLGIRVMTRS